MSPSTLVAGGITDDAGLKIAHSEGDEVSVGIRYPRSAAGANSYSVRVEPARLSVIVRPSEGGWIAIAPALNALGYGAFQQDALEDLGDSVEQYLEFLREDAPRLALAVAHHAMYIPLLDAPRVVWWASVDAPTPTDASPLE